MQDRSPTSSRREFLQACATAGAALTLPLPVSLAGLQIDAPEVLFHKMAKIEEMRMTACDTLLTAANGGAIGPNAKRLCEILARIASRAEDDTLRKTAVDLLGEQQALLRSVYRGMLSAEADVVTLAAHLRPQREKIRSLLNTQESQSKRGLIFHLFTEDTDYRSYLKRKELENRAGTSIYKEAFDRGLQILRSYADSVSREIQREAKEQKGSVAQPQDLRLVPVHLSAEFLEYINAVLTCSTLGHIVPEPPLERLLRAMIATTA